MAKVALKNIKGTWNEILNRCRTTVNKEGIEKEPSTSFKEKIVMSEHSPIRSMTFNFSIEDIPSYSATHFARHHVGVEKWISTSREDRTGVSRDERSQTDPVNMELEANMQALINLSRKRLCYQADPTTREVMEQMKAEVEQEEPIVAHHMVKECVYRGGICPEINSCGYNKTEAFRREMWLYLHQLTDEDLECLDEHSLAELGDLLMDTPTSLIDEEAEEMEE